MAMTPLSRYTNKGHRDPAAKAAMRRENRRQKDIRVASRKPRHVHGTYNGYCNYGCRCKPCREAGHRYYKSAKRRGIRA